MRTARLFLLSLGFAGVLTSLAGHPRWGWVYPTELVALAAGLVLLLIERHRERRP